jgi:ABC-type multidrug transport system ATPase subunit
VLSIQVNKLGKKFNREWIFRELSHAIAAGGKLVILGSNGSGKSTLLQVLSGFVTPNEGEIIYRLGERTIPTEKIKDQLAFASPYLQLIEEFTLRELIDHARTFKPFHQNMPTGAMMERMELSAAASKPIKQFSSGMKQRLKLGLAFLSDTPLLLLDEPVSNLDKQAIAWYKGLVADYTAGRTVLVCSNAIVDEHFFCDTALTVTDFKPGNPKN